MRKIAASFLIVLMLTVPSNSNFSLIQYSIGVWILASGSWNDTGIWIDSNIWNG
jgi:hypothetical protein